MASPFLQAWTVIKSRTNRNQRGALGYGSPVISEQIAGDQTQPFTGFNVRQRVPLVGAQRVDEIWTESGDPESINRRAAEKTGMERNMAADKESKEPFDVEESADEFHERINNQNRQALEQMLMGSSTTPPMTMGAMRPDMFQTSEPMEIAFRLLKNTSMDFGEVADETPPAPDPLGEALERARNQGPAPGANLEALPPAGPDPQVSRKYMKDPVQRGLDKYHPPAPPPMTEEDKALLAQLRMGGMPPNLPPRGPTPIAGADDGVEPFIHFNTRQHSDGSMHPMG